MVEELDYGYRECLWLEYTSQAGLDELLRVFKHQIENSMRGTEVEVFPTASGALSMIVIAKTYFMEGRAEAVLLFEPLSTTVCGVTTYAMGDKVNTAATHLNRDINEFIREECRSVVRVIEGQELSDLKRRLLEKSQVSHLKYGGAGDRSSRSRLSSTQIAGGICPVCHDRIEPLETVSSCPYCHAKAHREHLLEWIHVKGTCPSCQKGLRADQVRDSRPSTRRRTR
jgi:hypothetical protein